MCLFSEDLLEFPCCLQLHLSATRNLTDMNSQKVVIVCLILHIKVCFICCHSINHFFFAKVIEQLQGILQFIVKNPSEVHTYMYIAMN